MYRYLDIEQGWVLIPEPRDTSDERSYFGCDACGALVWDTRKHDEFCPAKA